MKFIPIPLSTFEVKAILDVRKTQLRKLVKEKIQLEREWETTHPSAFSVLDKNGNQFFNELMHSPHTLEELMNINIGDVFWVREQLKQIWEDGIYYMSDGDVWWDDNGFVYKNGCCNVPSIHMPREACRIFLRIKKIRVIKLHDISEEDAFRTLWMKKNGARSWWSTPWAWVIEFEKIELTEDLKKQFLTP